jgi:hypothetical protein
MPLFGKHFGRLGWALRCAVVLIALNFFAFIAGNFYLGGDALNGYMRAGHYFVCAHGGCREVSRSVWLYSYWHALSAVTGLVFFIVIGVFCKASGHRLRRHA